MLRSDIEKKIRLIRKDERGEVWMFAKIGYFIEVGKRDRL